MKAFSITMLFAMLGLFAVGCGPKADPSPPAKPKAEHAEHPEHGPHNGELIELGKEEFHAELCHDEATEKVTIYLLDHEAKKAVAIPDADITLNLIAGGAPQQFKLPAVRQSDDPAGQSSKFELTEAKLCDGIRTKGNKARLNVSIKGQPYLGEYVVEEEHAHDHSKDKK